MSSTEHSVPDEASPQKAEYARYLKALGARVRSLRKQRGWSWRDMVVLHDFHLSKWQSYESGRYGISLPSLLRISKLFEMSVSALLAGLEEEATLLEPASEIAGDSEEIASTGKRKRPKKTLL